MHTQTQIHYTRQSFDAKVTPQDLVDTYMGTRAIAQGPTLSTKEGLGSGS